jgi:hypothetical protein
MEKTQDNAIDPKLKVFLMGVGAWLLAICGASRKRSGRYNTTLLEMP